MHTCTHSRVASPAVFASSCKTACSCGCASPVITSLSASSGAPSRQPLSHTERAQSSSPCGVAHRHRLPPSAYLHPAQPCAAIPQPLDSRAVGRTNPKPGTLHTCPPAAPTSSPMPTSACPAAAVASIGRSSAPDACRPPPPRRPLPPPRPPPLRPPPRALPSPPPASRLPEPVLVGSGSSWLDRLAARRARAAPRRPARWHPSRARVPPAGHCRRAGPAPHRGPRWRPPRLRPPGAPRKRFCT